MDSSALLSVLGSIGNGVSGVGVFIMLFIAYRTGMLKFLLNGNSPSYQEQINLLKDHAAVANQEMGEIQKSISRISVDVAFIKGKLSK